MMRWLLSIVSLVIALVFSFVIVMQTETVQKYFLKWGQEHLYENYGFRSDVGSLSWNFPAELDVQNITVLSPEGETFSCKSIKIDFSWTQLLLGNIHLPYISLKNLVVKDRSFDIQGKIFWQLGHYRNADLVVHDGESYYHLFAEQQKNEEINLTLSHEVREKKQWEAKALVDLSDESLVWRKGNLSLNQVAKPLYLKSEGVYSFVNSHLEAYGQLVGVLDFDPLDVAIDLDIRESVWKGYVSVPKLLLSGLVCDAAPAQFLFYPTPDSLKGVFSYSTLLNELPLGFQGMIDWGWKKEDPLQFEDLSLFLPHAQGCGFMTFNLGDGSGFGEISFQSDQVRQAVVEDLMVEGEALGQISFSFETQKTLKAFLDWQLVLPHLKLSNLAGDEIALRGSLIVKEEAIPVLEGAITIEKIHAGGTAFEGFKLSLSREGILEWYMQSEAQEKFLGRGLFRMAKDAFIGQLAELQGVWDGKELSLLEPLNIRFADDAFLFDHARFKWGDSTVEGQMDGHGGEIQAHLEFDNIALNHWIIPSTSIPLQASLKAEIDWHQPKDGLWTLNAILTANQVSLNQMDTHPFPVDGTVVLHIGNKMLSTVAAFVGKGDEVIGGEFRAPLKESSSWLGYEVDLLGAIEGSFQGVFELAPFVDSFLSDRSAASGLAKFSLALDGSLSDPMWSVALDLQSGVFESLTAGTLFHDIKATILCNNHEIIVEKIEGNDLKGGLITGAGRMKLNEPDYPFEINLDINAIQLIRLPFANAKTQGKGRFWGDVKTGHFDGTLNVSDFIVNIPEETPALFRGIDVSYINYIDEPRLGFMLDPNPWPILLDVDFIFSKDALIKGDQFTSNWRGEIKLKGTQNDPLLYGRAKLTKGDLEFNGQRWPLNQGSIHFSGEPGRKNNIYLIASQEMEGVKIDMIFKGLMQDLEISFRSNPPKSNREIVSWLLFNRGLTGEAFTGEESIPQKIKLSSQGSSSPSLFEKIRSSTGLDRIDISSKKRSSEDDVSFRVGKYLSKRFFISFGKNITTNANEAAIEATLHKNLKASGEIDDSAEGRLMLKWEKDY